jgi:hypothetical protein
MPTAIEVSPEDIFEAFLYEQNSRGRTEWQRHDKKVHRAFYLAKKEFPDLMEAYSVLLRTEPYSHTLDRMFWEFRQARILARVDENIVIRNPKALEKPDETLGRVAEYICDRV